MILSKMKISDIKNSDLIKVSCRVNRRELYFKLHKKYERYIDLTYDCFVLTMLPLALRKGEDIIVKGKMSEKLWVNMRNFLIPHSLVVIPKCSKQIAIIPDELVHEIYESENAVGAALSCGVDSLVSFEDYYFDETCPKNYRITHAFNFCVGAHGRGQKGYSYYVKRRQDYEEYARLAGVEFLPVWSNLSNFDEFSGYNYNFAETHIFRNMAVPHLFPRLFSKVYSASAASYRQVQRMTNLHGDIGYANSSMINLMSTENIECINVSSKYTREQRIQRIAKNPLTKQFLHVCHATRQINPDKINCARCDKCLRTLVAIEGHGLLEEFEEIFDVEEYLIRREDYIKKMRKRNMHFDRENLALLKAKKETEDNV